MNLILGDCLEKLKELDANSVDAIVTDPPYFLTNANGSGFMGKEWDSLSIANAFAESILRSLSPVWLMAEASSVQENASTQTNLNSPEKNIHALYVQRNSIDQNPSLSLGTFSVQASVLTRAEVLALSTALCPSLTSVFESQPSSVLYVVPTLFPEKEPINIVRDVALRLVTAKICEEIKTLHTLMEGQNLTEVIEATIGSKSDSKFISATSSNVKSVESTVAEKRYSATTSSPIEYQKTIRWITSLRFVRNAMVIFTANPGNIQILSERFHYLWAKEVFRVLKPGAHLLAFAGTRTYHPLANAVQSAGFEIRDQIQWIYGSGFPKSLDVSKAIDKAAGVEREVVAVVPHTTGIHRNHSLERDEWDGGDTRQGKLANEMMPITAPATPLAKQWQGFGTALKPANEPIVLARKPLEKGLTVAQNVQKWGCGAINIDASRIGMQPATTYTAPDITNDAFNSDVSSRERKTISVPAQGRWPANAIFDEEAACLLDEQSGILHSRPNKNPKALDASPKWYENKDPNKMRVQHDVSGGASRFFYIAKASKRERNAGLEGMPEKEAPGSKRSTPAEGRTSALGAPRANHHPTVKPVKLMEYLCKLITPPKGIILDPFCGSGTTGVAAKRLGFEFVGIEMSEEYLEIAKKRMEFARERIQDAEAI